MTSRQPKLGLPLTHKLRDSREFASLRLEGRRAASGCLVANWRVLAEPARSRVGVIAGRKVGPAVVRNRARRLLREAFRLHRHEFNRPIDLVLVARGSIVGKRLADVEKDLLGVLRRTDLVSR